MQGKTLAGLAVSDGWRHLQPFEDLGAAIRLPGIGADEIAGQQGIDAGDAAGANARAHHPEGRVFTGEVIGLFDQIHRGRHAFLVTAQFHRRHMADHHVAVLDLGFVGGQAFAGLEGDLDGRPLLQPVVHHQ
ncbi:hypothetical protein D9M71_730190 [compost metagenome]